MSVTRPGAHELRGVIREPAQGSLTAVAPPRSPERLADLPYRLGVDLAHADLELTLGATAGTVIATASVTRTSYYGSGDDRPHTLQAVRRPGVTSRLSQAEPWASSMIRVRRDILVQRAPEAASAFAVRDEPALRKLLHHGACAHRYPLRRDRVLGSR